MSETERNTGVDLLKIVSTMMVLVMHILYTGGILANTISLPVQYRTAWLLELLSYSSVNCFALITGYNCYGRRFSAASLGTLWLRVLWYSLGITAVFQILKPEAVNAVIWRSSFLPVTHGVYWYFSSYVLAMLLLPALNRELARLSAARHGLVTGAALALVFLSSMAAHEDHTLDPFGLFRGFSAMWLLLLFILGGWLKRTGAEKKIAALPSLGGFLLCVLLSWGEKMLRTRRLGPWDFDGLFIQYTSVLTTGAAVFLLLFFARLKLPEKAGRVITGISATSFSVYIIHTHPLFSDHILTGLFSRWSVLGPRRLVLYVCGAAAGTYALLSLTDLPRELLFGRLKLYPRLRELEKKMKLPD